MAPKRLTDLSSEEFKTFLYSFDYVLSDLDGVLFHEGPLPKAGEVINLLKQHGKQVYYVTNNSMLSFEEHQERFREINVEITEEELFYPPKMIVKYLKSIDFKKKIYAVSCTHTVEHLRRNGFECDVEPLTTDHIKPYFVVDEYKKFMADDESVGAVVYDCCLWANIWQIQKSVVYLNRPDVLFLEGATDKIMFRPESCNLIGPGLITELVAKFVGRESIVLAKPNPVLSNLIKDTLNIKDPRRALYIGDAIDQDMRFANTAGFQTLFIESTCTIDRLMTEGVVPNYYLSALEDVLPQFSSMKYV